MKSTTLILLIIFLCSFSGTVSSSISPEDRDPGPVYNFKKSRRNAIDLDIPPKEQNECMRDFLKRVVKAAQAFTRNKR